jgi:hydroxymethylpyrimidine/phosphomethylpyrimidine kinase
LRPPVVDPVMVSTSGHDLIGDEAFQILKTQLLPVAGVVTPNIPEAERLAGFSIESEADMRRAAEAIRQFGARAVLVKGGHRAIEQQAIDLLLDESGRFVEFREEFIDVGEIHGSGCTLSAAIATCLAKDLTLEEAVRTAKNYITERIRVLQSAPRVGHGARPV